ncbi:MAG: hypothetical protein QG622_3569, partial [Actinomycetota bacterium]|nr:hypothetical protein [Actinomycetota bacterium]
MRSRQVHETPGATPSAAHLVSIIGTGRFGDASAALTRVASLLPHLEKASDPELLLIARWGAVELKARAGADHDEIMAACDLLERTASERLNPVWAAVARTLRATIHLDAGTVGDSLSDLTSVDLDQFSDDLAGPGGAVLLDVLASAYSRLRLFTEVDAIRERSKTLLDGRPPLDRVIHWAHRATELAIRALEPMVTGEEEGDAALLQQAVENADQLSTVSLDLVPDLLRRGADAVRALEATFRGRPAEALRLLGEDAFQPPNDLPGLERRIAMLAAMHAQVRSGEIDVARAMDDEEAPPSSLPFLVLEVAMAEERLRLETRNDGDLDPVRARLTRLTRQLGRTGMDLVAGTARSALAHRALRAENRTDPLTGLGNRRAFDEDLREAFRSGRMPVSLLLVDIDGFHAVNECFSLVGGDAVLTEVASALGDTKRAGARLARYDGDTFAVLLPLTTDAEAKAAARRISSAVKALTWPDLSSDLTVTVTVGRGTIASPTHRRPDGDAEQLVRLADGHLRRTRRKRANASTPPAAATPQESAPPVAPSVPVTPPVPVALPAPAVPPPVPPPLPVATPIPVPPPVPVATPVSRPHRRRHAGPPAEETSPAAQPPAAQPPVVQPPVVQPPVVQPPVVQPSTAQPPAVARPGGRDDPLGLGRGMTGSLYVPLSPPGGLPLYQALLQDPPRVDPHLGLLPPLGINALTAPDAFTRRTIPPSFEPPAGSDAERRPAPFAPLPERPARQVPRAGTRAAARAARA